MLITDCKRGFTLIEALVGVALLLIVFMGIFGAYQLGLRVIGQSKSRIVATALANAEIEKIRVLPYASIGTLEGFPEGILEPLKTNISSGLEYTIETRIDYVVDSRDGISAPEDECPNDYKKAEVKISWSGLFEGEVKLTTDIAPDSLAQECLEIGGILSVSVFDAYGIMVLSPLIEIRDYETDEVIKLATPDDGNHFFSLSPDTYKVLVSKSSYSSSRTYGIEEVAIPEKPHPLVLEGALTEISFSIDRISSFSVGTLSLWTMDYFSDSFVDSTKVFEFLDVVISDGEVVLDKIDDDYLDSGYLTSIDIIPEDLISWEEFSWNDSKVSGTQILYQVLYFDELNWVLIPDSDLSENSLGFTTSPVDLSSLDIAVYPQLRVKANLSTTDPTVSPILYDWQVSWRASGATPISNVSFHLQGEKIIGLDEDENPVYKYSQDHNSGSTGFIDIYNLEWDSYTFSLDPSTGLDLVQINPSSQPIGLDPNTTLPVSLYLGAQNSLLFTVQDIDTGQPIFSATIRLYNSGLGYDETQYTNEDGQFYFIPLETATYNIEVQGPGYSNYSGTVWVSGDKTKVVSLERVE